MRLLFDTNVWLWIHTDPRRIGAAAREQIERADSLLFSHVSVWEISIKYAAGRLPLPARPRDYVRDRLAGEPIVLIPIALDHLFRAAELPRLHADPFDRLLVGQALVDDLTLVTSDQALVEYGVPTLIV